MSGQGQGTSTKSSIIATHLRGQRALAPKRQKGGAVTQEGEVL